MFGVREFRGLRVHRQCGRKAPIAWPKEIIPVITRHKQARLHCYVHRLLCGSIVHWRAATLMMYPCAIVAAKQALACAYPAARPTTATALYWSSLNPGWRNKGRAHASAARQQGATPLRACKGTRPKTARFGERRIEAAPWSRFGFAVWLLISAINSFIIRASAGVVSLDALSP